MLALSGIEIKRKRRHCQWENSSIHIHKIYKEKVKKEKQWNCRWEKMSKAIEENKLTGTIKRLMRILLYWKFMFIGKNNDKNKTNLPLVLFHSSYSFCNCWKTTKPMTFHTFSLFLLTFLSKINVIAWLDYIYYILNLLEEGRF